MLTILSQQKPFEIEGQVVVILAPLGCWNPARRVFLLHQWFRSGSPENSRLIKVHVWGLRFAAYVWWGFCGKIV